LRLWVAIFLSLRFLPQGITYPPPHLVLYLPYIKILNYSSPPPPDAVGFCALRGCPPDRAVPLKTRFPPLNSTGKMCGTAENAPEFLLGALRVLAASHAARARSRARRICLRAAPITPVPVPAPFPPVPMHIVQTPRIRRKTPHRRRLFPIYPFCVPVIRIPAVIIRLLGRDIIAGIERRRCSGAACVFPLSLRRQPVPVGFEITPDIVPAS
jgi:hypothetical protein